MTTIDEGVLRRLKKCLALAESSEPGEAAAAMHQAQRLMEKYGLTQAHIDGTLVTEARVQGTRGRNIAQWESMLVHACCRAYGGKVLWRDGPRGGWKKEHNGTFIFIGTEAAVKCIEYTYVVLVRQLLKARARYIEEQLPYHWTRPQKAAYADSYCLGYTQRLYEKVVPAALDERLREALARDMERRTAGSDKKASVKDPGKAKIAAMSSGYEDAADASLFTAATARAAAPQLTHDKEN